MNPRRFPFLLVLPLLSLASCSSPVAITKEKALEILETNLASTTGYLFGDVWGKFESSGPSMASASWSSLRSRFAGYVHYSGTMPLNGQEPTYKSRINSPENHRLKKTTVESYSDYVAFYDLGGRLRIDSVIDSAGFGGGSTGLISVVREYDASAYVVRETYSAFQDETRIGSSPSAQFTLTVYYSWTVNQDTK